MYADGTVDERQNRAYDRVPVKRNYGLTAVTRNAGPRGALRT